MQNVGSSISKPTCVLGAVESIYGLGYQYCTTCGVFHPQPESEPANAPPETPHQHPAAARADAGGRARLTLVKHEFHR